MNIKLSKVTANDISNMSKKEVIQYICDVTALNCFNTTYERKTYNHDLPFGKPTALAVGGIESQRTRWGAVPI